MPRRFLKYIKPIIIILIVIGLIVLSVKTFDLPYVNKVGDYISYVIRPAQTLLYSTSQYVQDVFISLRELGTIKRDNVRLKNEVLKLQEQNRQLNELRSENQRLKQALNFKDANPGVKFIGASVIARNSLSTLDTFAINVGKNDGVRQNMAVITSEGLVGRVIQVSDNWSKVISILDQNSAVSAIDITTRDNGIIRGDQVNNELIMEYIPVDAKIKVGDDIETSGLGGIFPKGLYIGKIVKIKKSAGNLMKIATIKPGADFKRIEEILVIISGSQKIILSGNEIP